MKDGKRYHLPKKVMQAEMAHKSGMNYAGKLMERKHANRFGDSLILYS